MQNALINQNNKFKTLYYMNKNLRFPLLHNLRQSIFVVGNLYKTFKKLFLKDQIIYSNKGPMGLKAHLSICAKYFMQKFDGQLHLLRRTSKYLAVSVQCKDIWKSIIICLENATSKIPKI